MNLYLATALMLFGIAAYFLQVLAALEDEGTHLTPLAYLRQHPYRFASLVVSSFIVLLITRKLEQLTEVTAVLIGYACQSAADTIRKRANARMNP